MDILLLDYTIYSNRYKSTKFTPKILIYAPIYLWLHLITLESTNLTHKSTIFVHKSVLNKGIYYISAYIWPPNAYGRAPTAYIYVRIISVLLLVTQETELCL